MADEQTKEIENFSVWGSECLGKTKTYEEAVKRSEEALAVYLETLVENGDPIPEEHTNAPVSLGVTVRTPIIA